MKHQTPDSMKFRKLARRLGVRQYEAAGILEMLWIATQKNAPRGDIGRWDNEEIAIAIDWPGSADELVDALVECGWLDRCDTHRLVVHDWHTHAPRYIHGVVAKCGGFVSAVDDYSEPLQCGTIVDDCSEGQPNLTKPNVTKPNVTINTGRPVAAPPVVVDEEVYEGYRDRLVAIHKAVDGKRGLRREDRHTAILAAVLARERLGEDWLDEILGSAKLRRGELKNPWAYFKKACISSVVRRGENWDELCRGVRIEEQLLNGRQPVPAGTQEAQCTS